MTAGPRQVRHFIGSAARHHGTNLDGVVGFEQGVTGDESSVADDEMSLARELELGEQCMNSTRPVDT
ncbi:MAG: hypothetical protein RLZ86_388 [Actinomycetota bacterium]